MELEFATVKGEGHNAGKTRGEMMPIYTLEPCARCGCEAKMINEGSDWKRRYIVRCTQAPTKHFSAPFGHGREAQINWNELQIKLTGAGESNLVKWVDKRVRMPWESDADAYGCVLIYDRLNGVKVTGWRNIQELNREAVTHWARMPEGPKE